MIVIVITCFYRIILAPPEEINTEGRKIEISLIFYKLVTQYMEGNLFLLNNNEFKLLLLCISRTMHL